MKKRMFSCLMLITFLIELAILVRFALLKPVKPQDTVAVNETVQTLQRNWGSVENAANSAALNYVVLHLDGTILYRTKPGLSETVNAASGAGKSTLLYALSGMDTPTLGTITFGDEMNSDYSQDRLAVFPVTTAVLYSSKFIFWTG
ncbi:ATP-binding cassette domain-containing protein [Lachnospiraceae bacterium 45-W7]